MTSWGEHVSGCERKPAAERKRDSAQPQEKGAAINNVSGCERKPDKAQPSIRRWTSYDQDIVADNNPGGG
jgi:hypothetical protein